MFGTWPQAADPGVFESGVPPAHPSGPHDQRTVQRAVTIGVIPPWPLRPGSSTRQGSAAGGRQRKVLVAADQEALRPTWGIVGIDREFACPAQQGGQYGSGVDAGEGGSHAVVDALPEGEDGLRDSSLGRIAELSGYSTAAIYKFFDSKQHLVTETLNRRADEYLTELKKAAARGTPLERLQFIVDAAAGYFSARKNFSSLIRQVQGGAAILGPVLAAFADDVYGRYGQAMALMTDLVREGQKSGEIRAGDPRALAHLASVLTNEFVLDDLPLTLEEFHAVFDGTLRTPIRRTDRRSV